MQNTTVQRRINYLHPDSKTGLAQRGSTLLVVMALLMLSALVVLSASRMNVLAEQFVGNDADDQRTQELAQALITDATLDITGRQSDGKTLCPPASNYCRPATANVSPAILAVGEQAFFPQTPEQYTALLSQLRGNPCGQGICAAAKGMMTDFWQDPQQLTTLKKTAATYTSHTGGSQLGATTTGLLTSKAWYWVEVLLYDSNALTPSGIAPTPAFAPDPTSPFVYRITALAEGRKSGVRAVVQTYYVAKPINSTNLITGQARPITIGWRNVH